MHRNGKTALRGEAGDIIFDQKPTRLCMNLKVHLRTDAFTRTTRADAYTPMTRTDGHVGIGAHGR